MSALDEQLMLAEENQEKEADVTKHVENMIKHQKPQPLGRRVRRFKGPKASPVVEAKEAKSGSLGFYERNLQRMQKI